jgi:hypothetical protein
MNNTTNNTIFPRRHSKDNQEKYHCVKCGCVLKEIKKEKSVIKKHKVLFNGRYCVPCSSEVEREVENIISNYFGLKVGYFKVMNMLMHIIKLYDLNHESDLFYYLDNIKRYLEEEENKKEFNKLLSL